MMGNLTKEMLHHNHKMLANDCQFLSMVRHLRKARAIAIRCRSPPLSFRPRSPTRVSNPSGILSTVIVS